MGNMFSVQHACASVGLSSHITSQPDEILKADAAILPGVGAFAEAMDNLKWLDLVGCIMDFIASGKPFMGVCLGMQLLFTESEEFGMHEGLGIVDGSVLRFPSLDRKERKLKVPQIGWNRIRIPTHCIARKWDGTPLDGLEDGAYMYFVHSYYAFPQSSSVVLSTTEYGGVEYCSSLKMGNLFATQFHPEKSARHGIAIYRKWAEISQAAKENRYG